MIFRRSPDVPALEHSADYRPYLRVDFQHRCEDCLTHEKYFLDGEAGEIDHHRPRHPSPKLGLDFSPLENEYGNLYWMCRKCNNSKGNRWPTEWQYAHGRRFLDPCEEDTTPIGSHTLTAPSLRKHPPGNTPSDTSN